MITGDIKITVLVGGWHEFGQRMADAMAHVGRTYSTATHHLLGLENAIEKFTRRMQDHREIQLHRWRAQASAEQHLAATAAAVYADLGLVPPADSIIRTRPHTETANQILAFAEGAHR